MTSIEDLCKNEDAMKRLEQAIQRVSNEVFYIVRPDAPPGKVFYNKKMDLYIMRRDMVESFMDHMLMTGIKLIELEEQDISDALLPKEC